MKYLFLFLIIPFMMIFKAEKPIKKDTLMKSESTDLYYLVSKPKESTKQAPVLILLHGYGSNENDFFSLSKQIPDNWLVVSARAPFAITNNQYKWYNVKLIDEKISINFNEEEQSRKALLQLVNQIVIEYQANKNQVVVAGFSQGANMALGLALTEPKTILAAGCFSGRIMEEIKPLIKNKEALQTKQVFIAHGTEDQMLPFALAEENKKTLEKLGMQVTFSPDKIAHSISKKQLGDFKTWLNHL